MRQRTASAAKRAPAPDISPGTTQPSPMAQRIARPHSRDEAETRYDTARDAWTAAMRAANSGRPADLASLAIAQEEYEAAAAERERWTSSNRVAIPVEPEADRTGVDIAVRQELAWRDVRQPHDDAGLVTRIRRRLFGR